MRHQRRVKTNKMLKAVVTIFWVQLAAIANAQTPPHAVDRAVALVDNAVVTASDLRVHFALSSADDSFVPILQPSPDTTLEDAIHATIIQTMAGRISVYQPNPAQVQARVNAYRAQWLVDEDWAKHLLVLGLNEKSILRAFERRLIIERVVSRNLGTPDPTDSPEWDQQFRSWLDRERQSVRVRLVAPTSPQSSP